MADLGGQKSNGIIKVGIRVCTLQSLSIFPFLLVPTSYLIPLGASDKLHYFIVALPGPSI